MDPTELNLIKQYAWLIPPQPVPQGQVIDQLVKKLHAVPMEPGEIPNMWMHEYNAVHLPKNEELQLTVPQLQIKAIKIPINAQTQSYTDRDFVSLSFDASEDYIYLAYEEQVGYHYSNSNKLFCEAVLMEGIDQRDMDARTENYMVFLFRLKNYDELYCGKES